MSRLIDLTGQIFGLLTVIRQVGIDRWKSSLWICTCSCNGKELIVSSGRLRSKNTQSCGCLRDVKCGILGSNSKIHGMHRTRIYKIWQGMKQRCMNPNDTNYFRYGGHGVKLCDKWQTFEGFFADNGESYNKHVEEFGEDNTTADKWPNNDGNYEKGNFRWATMGEQVRSRSDFPKSENWLEHKRFILCMRTIMVDAIKGRRESSPLLKKYTDLDVKEFRDYIQSLWEPWMNWNNYGNGIGKWSIDHVIECHTFDLSKEEDRLRCYNCANLRPYDSCKNSQERNRSRIY